MDNRILIDWFSFTTTIHSVSSVLHMLGLEHLKNFVNDYGSKGFKDRISYSGLNISFNNFNDSSLIWVEFTGQGCRLFDEQSSIDWDDLFCMILSEEDYYNVTRLDVAYDDFNGLLDINKIYLNTIKGNWISKFRTWSCIKSNKGNTVYIGSIHSSVRFTFYDKAAERLRDDIKHWVRLEIRIKQENALQFIKELNNNSIGNLYYGVVNHYLRFVRPSKSDSNKQRWETQNWWLKFLGTAERISLWTKCDRNYNLKHCEDFVYKQAGSALDTLINIKGVGKVLEELKEYRPAEKNIKYLQLEKEYKANEGILNYLVERNAL